MSVIMDFRVCEDADNVHIILPIEKASSIPATLLVILIAAFDVLGEKTSVQLERVTGVDTSFALGRVRFEGNEVDASKLSQIVDEGSNVASAAMRVSTRKTDKRTGRMIRTVVTMGRRFCNNQCFHNNSANCPVFDITMSPIADALLPVSTHTSHSFSLLFILGLGWVKLQLVRFCAQTGDNKDGQTAGWTKMALGMEVGLGPGHILLDRVPAPLPQKRGQSPPIFGRFLLWPNSWMHQGATLYGGRPQPSDFVLDGDTAPSPKRVKPPIFGPRLLWPNGCMDQDATWYGGKPRPTRHCVRWEPTSPSPKGAQPPDFRPLSACAVAANALSMASCGRCQKSTQEQISVGSSNLVEVLIRDSPCMATDQ